MKTTEHTEKLFFVLYIRIKYQFASEIKNPVDGTTSENAQIPFAGPEGVAASSETPTVMSANESKLYTFKEREWVVTGWAEGQMETEREDDKGQKVIVMQPYYQLFVISPVSSYKSDNYSANGMKAEKLRCVSNAVWKDLKPLEVVNLYFDEKKRVSLAASTGVSVELNEVSF